MLLERTTVIYNGFVISRDSLNVFDRKLDVNKIVKNHPKTHQLQARGGDPPPLPPDPGGTPVLAKSPPPVPMKSVSLRIR